MSWQSARVEAIPALTGMRFIAALMVFVSHYNIPGLRGNFLRFVNSGYSGVTFFFVLSGFVLAYNYFGVFEQQFARSIPAYFISRLARVYPLYLFCTLFAWFSSGGSTPLVPYLGAVQAWSSSSVFAYGLDGPSWSISVEAFLYLCFPVIFLIFRSVGIIGHRRRALAVALIVVAMQFALAYWFISTGHGSVNTSAADPNSSHRWLYRNPATRLFDFTLGILTAAFALRSGEPSRRSTRLWSAAIWMSLLSVAMLMAAKSIYFTAWSWDAVYALPFAVCIAGITLSGRSLVSRLLSTRSMVTLGASSYPFYLLHMLMRPMYTSASVSNSYAFYTAFLIFVVATSVGFHFAIEEPCRRLVRTTFARIFGFDMSVTARAESREQLCEVGEDRVTTRGSGTQNLSTRGTLAMRISVVFLAVLTTALLGYRMTIGVDLSDESYYLSFVDGWLKTGFHHSDALVIHQTAELLIFPFVKIFVALQTSEQGLALFNRFLYLGASLIAGLCFYRFARLRHTLPVAVLSGILITSFIPFSLPSPSYNTLAMSGLICALASYAVFAETHRIRWAIVSSAGWMICVFAYPTFIAVLICFLVVIAFQDARVSAFRRYLSWCLCFQLLGAVILVSAYGVDRLEQILMFTSASLQVTRAADKLTKAVLLVVSSRVFTGLCIASMIVGAVAGRRRMPEAKSWIVVAGIVAILTADSLAGPTLFAVTHDYVFLLAIAGTAFFAANLIHGQSSRRPLDPLFLVGLFAGIVTSLTATNSIVNFAIGGFVCVAFFLLAVFSGETRMWPHLVLLASVTGLFLLGDFQYVYGEGDNPAESASAERVRSGVFAGLLTSAEKHRAIRETTDFLATQHGDSVAVIGRLPGIYLLTPMRPKTLSTWDFSQQKGAPPKLDGAISQFYEQPANLPSVVLDVVDPWTRQPSASSKALMGRYQRESSINAGLWTVEAMIQTRK